MIIKNRKPEIYNAKINLTLLFLRLISGGFMLTHGIPKLLKVIQGPPFKFSDPLGMGVTASILLTTFAEVICAGFIIIGFFTRLSTIPLIITMAVAAFIVHASDPFFAREMPLLYISIYLAIAILGPGGYSVDRFINLKKR
jgi:putative oxidoreductase